MEKITNYSLDDWFVQGNDLIGQYGPFALIISVQGFDKEKIEGRNDIHFETDGVGFLLNVLSYAEGKRAVCGFTSLQETLFFIYSYLENCNSISEVDEMYYTYRISADTTNNKGYVS